MEYRNALALRFFWVFLLGTVLVVAAMLLLMLTFRLPPLPIMGLLPAAVAGADAGVQYVRKAGKALDGRLAWRLSAVLMAVSLAVTFVIALGSGALRGMPLGAVQLLLTLMVFGAINFCLIRFFLGMGAGQEMRRSPPQ